MKKYVVSIVLAFVLSATYCFATTTVQKVIRNLRTCYQKNPLGMEEKPMFSWEMDAKGTYGSIQKYYRVEVATNKKNLDRGKLLFDTGKKLSGLSVGIPYEGPDLKACSRYYWKVTIWDEKNNEISSQENAWFETALMNTGWGRAQWIGSPSSVLSKYTGTADIYVDFQLGKKSNQVGFIFSHRDDNNFMLVNIIASKKKIPFLVLSHKSNGKIIEDRKFSLDNILDNNNLYNKHKLEVKMQANDHFSGYLLDIILDGKSVKDSIAINKDKGKIIIIPEYENMSWKYARLYGIGFLEEPGQIVTFNDIRIREQLNNVLMYEDSKVHIIKGNGQPVTWIPNDEVGAPMLRKTFTLTKTIAKARLYASSRGIFEMSLNGKNISQDFYNSGWTDYRYRQNYNIFDVTSLVCQGKNAIGALLGKGWYTGSFGYRSTWANAYDTAISMIAKLVVTYVDGTKEIIVTDPSWLYSDNGPIIENGMLDGEDYDARREILGWNTADYDDTTWGKVKVYEPLGSNVIMQAYIGQPVRIDQICTAKKLSEPLPKHYIYDMGQNMVGVPRLLIYGKKGQEITIRYAEMTYPEIIPTNPISPYTLDIYKERKGQMYVDNYRGALSVDHYICKGDPAGEIFEPHFTSHGFRYIEITGVDVPLALNSVNVLVLNSLQEKTSEYKTSNKLINKLYSNILWGQKGNFLAVPTDCPQRDERLGWTGDAQIFTRTATYNRNVASFYNRWLYSVRDDQNKNGNFAKFCPLSQATENDHCIDACPGWADVGIITPWQIYQQYGDKEILEQSYISMKKYITYLEKNAKDYIQPIGGYGDWVALLGTPSDLTNTAYSAYDAQLMSKIACILGKTEDAKHFDEYYANIKKAFAKRYLRDNGYLIMPKGSPSHRDSYSAAYGTGPKTTKDTLLDTQTGYILPLYVGLIDDSVKIKSVGHLLDLLKKNDYKLNTGFIGTPYMNLVLSDNGHDDIAYRMFEQDAFPSWIYPVLQGATTIWERWNSYTVVNGFGPVSMNSFNHYSYGAIEDWMMAYSAGIQRDESKPAYKHIILQPRIGGKFNFIQASFHSVYGEIKSKWEVKGQLKDNDASKSTYIYKATVPANTTATLILPLNKNSKVQVLIGNEGILSKKMGANKMIYELSSGNYKFNVE